MLTEKVHKKNIEFKFNSDALNVNISLNKFDSGFTTQK